MCSQKLAKLGTDPFGVLDTGGIGLHFIAMTCTEIVREIQRLPIQQQFELHETLMRLLKEHESALDLPTAARVLLEDYQTDPELTAFTALDSDDFHATR